MEVLSSHRTRAQSQPEPQG